MSPSEISTLRVAIETTAPFNPAHCVVWNPDAAQCVPVTHMVADGVVRLKDGYTLTLAREDVELAHFALVSRLAAPTT